MKPYNHEQAKVLCPMAAREVERLRDEVATLNDDCMYFETALRIAEKQLKRLKDRYGGF